MNYFVWKLVNFTKKITVMGYSTLFRCHTYFVINNSARLLVIQLLRFNNYFIHWHLHWTLSVFMRICGKFCSFGHMDHYMYMDREQVSTLHVCSAVGLCWNSQIINEYYMNTWEKAIGITVSWINIASNFLVKLISKRLFSFRSF